MYDRPPKVPPGGGIDASRPAEQRYRILGRIAVGGMAEIYLARMLTPEGFEREVVLKRLMPELQADHEFVQMFHDEARIASQMRHPSIVQIYELGELDGSLFISMELIRGVNLRDLATRLAQRGELMPIPHGVRVACTALEALAYAHRFTDASGHTLNVVHRDVSPQNIILTYDGTVKLVDFGVAKAEGRLHQTRAGLIKGKFAYMSPEQISGAPVDGRSDLFALSEVFYELLLRRHPFQAPSDMDVLRQILDLDPPHPSDIESDFPPTLGAILMRALNKNPGDRYSSAATMHDALEGFLASQRPVTAQVLARFVRELFADRLEMERQARAAGDDRMLIEAMTAGRAEPPAPRRRSNPRPPSDVPQLEAPPPARGAPRDRVVEIARPMYERETGPAAPGFLAYSGYTDPSMRRRRFQSQINGLFGPEGSAPGLPADGAGPPGRDYDDGEMPTMRGTVGIDGLSMGETPAPSRGAAPVAAPRPLDPKVVSGPRAVEPSGGEGRATPRRSLRPVEIDPSERPPSPRSRRAQDRFGLYLFFAGLAALLGAVVYAIALYQGSRAPLMRIEVRSTPAGADIRFDGSETGARTPTVFQNVASDREHTIELHLEGYPPHTRKILPSPDRPDLTVHWTFKSAEE